ncbi:MAG TPA: kelch repeat-containing protein [Polyangiaceae bacterium]
MAASISAHRARVSFAGLALVLLAGCGARTGLEGGVLPDESEAGPPPVADAGSVPQSIVLFGGLAETPDGGYSDQADTWVWTATTEWTEMHPPSSPSARYGAMAASLGGEVILFGGDGPVAETWSWNGATWTRVRPGGSPPPPLTSSVFSLLGQSLALFGGYDEGTIYEDVWRWDGMDWTHEAPAVTPSPREAPAGAVLDGSLVIFGGEDVDYEPLGDTWVYDGTSWTQVQPAHSPSPRRGAVAASLDGKLVMFGGDTLPPSYGDWLSVDETWVWDGTDWTQEQPAQSPDPRSFAGMAAAGGEILLFGGGKFGGDYAAPAGTWTWDGAAWTEHPGGGPSPRNGPAMAAR